MRFQHTSTESALRPRLAQPSIWESIVPRGLRERQWKSATATTTKKATNPASYFIWIYLLIGSQAIRIISTQNEHTAFVRRADLKLAKLREVVGKLQRGEEVDVEKVLGAGDETQEQEWEEALREIEDEERAWQMSRQKKREEQERLAAEQQDAVPVNEALDRISGDMPQVLLGQPAPPVAPGFY